MDIQHEQRNDSGMDEQEEQYTYWLIDVKKIYGRDLAIAVKEGLFWDEFVNS